MLLTRCRGLPEASSKFSESVSHCIDQTFLHRSQKHVILLAQRRRRNLRISFMIYFFSLSIKAEKELLISLYALMRSAVWLGVARVVPRVSRGVLLAVVVASALVMLEPMLNVTGSEGEDMAVMVSREEAIELVLDFLEAVGGVEVDEEGVRLTAAPLVAAVEAMRLSALPMVTVYGCEWTLGCGTGHIDETCTPML